MLLHNGPRGLQELRRLPPASLQDRPPVSLGHRMAELATPGMSVALIDDFEVAWVHGFGVLKAGGTEAVTPETLFQVGSISKLVFALAVARLAQEKTVDLDVDVNDYLTSWRVPSNRHWAPRITLRQLLSHSAGTTVHGFPGYPATGPWPTLPQILDGVAPANTEPVLVSSLPGLQVLYSGGGTTIAQLAVCDLLRGAFPDLMRSIVFAPVGMTSSSFEQPLPATLAARAAVGHPWNGTPIAGGWHVYPEMAAAGLWTTAQDLARLGVDFLRARRGLGSGLGLTPEMAAQMLAPPAALAQPGQRFAGLGFFCQGSGPGFHCGHPGINHGFVAEMRLLPEVGKGAVVMLNSNQGEPLRQEIFQALGREHRWPAEVDDDSPSPGPRAIIGRYRHLSGKCFEIVEVADGMALQFETQPPLAIVPAPGGAVVAQSLELKLTFQKDAAAQVVAAVLSQGNQIPLEFRKEFTAAAASGA